MTEVLVSIKRSNTICHYTHFSGFSESNCNGCHVGCPKMVESTTSVCGIWVSRSDLRAKGHKSLD